MNKFKIGDKIVFIDDRAKAEFIGAVSGNEVIVDDYYNNGFVVDRVSLTGSLKVEGCGLFNAVTPAELKHFKLAKPFDIESYEFSDSRVSMDSDGEITVDFEAHVELNGWVNEELYRTINKKDAIAIAKALGVTGDDL